ncbi:MAG: DUF4249 domain-containing protein [Cytophagales bacterium]|nr:DUF4249 domain-containing protein [Cytophagales bacterium]
MKAIFKLLAISIFLLTTGGCTELITLDTPRTDRHLAVEGFINNLDEGSWVRLSTTTPGLEGIGSNLLGINANVSLIHDDQVFLYEEVSPGSYFLAPEGFQGQVGETYRLRIVTANNDTYESEEVTIPAAVPIASTRAELVVMVLEIEGIETTQYFHDVYAEFVNSEKDQFIKIENQGMAEVFVDYEVTRCGLNLDLPRGPAAGLSCWSLRDPISSEIKLTTNIGLNRSENYDVVGIRVPFQFQARYVTTLTAHNMSVGSFNYWENVRQQLNNVGGPFDPPIQPLPGNLTNTEDSGDIVLGYFHAYGTSVAKTCFDRSDVPETADIPIIGPPCLITCEEWWAPATFDDPVGLELCE